MTDIDWNALSLEELKKIQKDATRAIDSFETRQRNEALAVLNAKAAELGYSLDELVVGGKAKAPKAAPKYAHPENPSKTWTGRGRQPNWIKDALERGQSLDELLIIKAG